MPDGTSRTDLVPSENCFVAHPDRKGTLGVVLDRRNEGETDYVKVRWGSERTAEWHPVAVLRNGFRPGNIVQDKPKSNTRKTLGTGTVISARRIAGRDMVLVQLHGTGESRWLPYENLIRRRDASLKFARREAPECDSAERFRLKALAYALDSWNQVTGALDRLDVDPLPHQIDLVHRIMTSDQSNWLIADDVGLGKTIEVGLLLAAMKRRRQARRVLVVCPAGVVRQWQDEMKYKFNEDFRIYGHDFNINQPSHWSSYDKVIVSIDRAKSDTHTPIFNDSGDWDVIVFDEAHHLSKIEGQAVTQRYRLAESLQGMTDAFIFLTGTPHQGKTDQFVNLLMLLRPDLGRRLAHIFTDPSSVAEVVLRNRKSLATDANGEFLFRGQDTHLVKVPLADSARDFDQQLQKYLKHGYAAALAGGNTGRAIGFVMTTYRKLASSSIAAIERALQRRSARLRGEAEDLARHMTNVEFGEIADAFQDGDDGMDNIDSIADDVVTASTGVNPFFDDEQFQIAELLTAAGKVKENDRKLNQFLREIVAPLRRQRQQLLIFTEYRATQEYLVKALERLYPRSGVTQIHGSMSLSEKGNNIARFNDRAQFMVSTEAGGEGINLHERCHILVNYDLPWNPRRLVQRSGRLYRYGQEERVIVFNLMADDGFDSRSLGMMLERVHSMAKDMSEVGAEFQEGLETEIIGELLERIDIASLLADNRTMDIHRSEAEIDEAVARAKQAKTQQERLFSRIEGYDPQVATALYTFRQDEVLAFLEGVLPYKGVQIRDRLYGGRVLELALPEDMRGRFSEFPERATFVRVTADRRLAMRHPDRFVSMDFASPFFTEMIEFAKSPEFKGEYAGLTAPESGTLGIYKIRWQNDQGAPRWETLLPVFLAVGSENPIINPEFFGSLLVNSSENQVQPVPANSVEQQKLLQRLEERAQIELANRCTALRHPNDIVLLAAANTVIAD